MMQIERDSLYVEHMPECIGRIERYVTAGRDAFLGSELTQDAAVRNLQTLGESSQRISDACKRRRPEIDWRAISGFRNILVPDYLGLDLNLVWLVIEKELPALKEALKELRGR